MSLRSCGLQLLAGQINEALSANLHLAELLRCVHPLYTTLLLGEHRLKSAFARRENKA
jgi:hypothetical protein